MPISVANLLPVAWAFALAVVLTPLVRILAHRTGMVAKPKIDRWHKKPTAMLGGVVIWLAVVISYFLFLRHTTLIGFARDDEIVSYGWVI
ncbi:MAG: hypothetical protein ABJB97_06835, partial [Acidobacteriota bacterium]